MEDPKPRNINRLRQPLADSNKNTITNHSLRTDDTNLPTNLQSDPRGNDPETPN